MNENKRYQIQLCDGTVIYSSDDLEKAKQVYDEELNENVGYHADRLKELISDGEETSIVKYIARCRRDIVTTTK